MPRSYVDLAIALRSISIHRMKIAQKVRRLQKQEEVTMSTLQERSQLESDLLLISHNVNQLRIAFRDIAKIEKSIKKRKQYEMDFDDHLAGRNRGGFPRRR